MNKTQVKSKVGEKVNMQHFISLLRTGDFTIIYWDRGEPTFYKGKWNKDKEYERDEYATMEKSRIDIDQYDMNGYLPDAVKWLTMALGGLSDSI